MIEKKVWEGPTRPIDEILTDMMLEAEKVYLNIRANLAEMDAVLEKGGCDDKIGKNTKAEVEKACLRLTEEANCAYWMLMGIETAWKASRKR